MKTKSLLKLSIVMTLGFLPVALCCHAQSWPVVNQEAKPGTRWWWLGSAVNKADLEWNISEYAKKGIGAVEITPLYGVQGNDANNINFLTPKWMQALNDCEELGQKYGVQIDMNCGTGWPFGGPEVTIDDAACKLVYTDTILSKKEFKKFRKELKKIEKLKEPKEIEKFTHRFGLAIDNPKESRLATLDTLLTYPSSDGQALIIAIYNGRTGQKVKRAAPGGEGYVIDHFSKTAVRKYLDKFDKAFSASQVPYPNTFFNDSYEVYGANWTPTLFSDFYRIKGYRLENYMPELLGIDRLASAPCADKDRQTVTIDFREVMSQLLLDNFTQQWTQWAHSHGVKTRNQAHGSPANLIDVYAAVDIPEIEGFGMSNFGIKGLRQETEKEFIRINDADLTMLKYAASAAHITGKPFTSSETFTWLTEHFRTSLSQCKPDFDLMMVSGVNHVYFHGTCFSPKDDPWPGWKFYASIDMSPTNSLWRDAGYFYDYITRVQSFMQWGKPDNDFLILLPYKNMISKTDEKGKKAGLIIQQDIHGMKKRAPEFISDVLKIDAMGYDCDYISEKYLLSTTVKDGRLVTIGGTAYKALVLPDGCILSQQAQQHIDHLKSQGAIITTLSDPQLVNAAKAEDIKKRLHLKAIRRSNDTGYHYFISNLTPDDIDEYVTLAVPFQEAYLFNALDGSITPAEIVNVQPQNRTTTEPQNRKVHIVLRSGESIILQTITQKPQNRITAKPQNRTTAKDLIATLDKNWTFSFLESAPEVKGTYQMENLSTWEKLPLENADKTMGTGVYETTFNLQGVQEFKGSRVQKFEESDAQYILDLGDVRESARVYLNGEFVGCAWCVPYTLDCSKYLKKGKNTLRIEVTNLPANRIADLDRQGVKWRKFNEINLVKLDYSKGDYQHWEPVPSGLNSPVRLYKQ